MTDLEAALLSIIGVFPSYMRIPYFAYNDAVLSTLGGLGYHIIQCDIDTLDWQDESTAPQTFQAGLDAGATITLAHDPLEQTVDNLVPYMINAIKAKGLQCKSRFDASLPISCTNPSQPLLSVPVSATLKLTGIAPRTVAIVAAVALHHHPAVLLLQMRLVADPMATVNFSPFQLQFLLQN
jgi:hypothetical protein